MWHGLFLCVSGRVCLRYVPVRFVCLIVLCDAIWSVLVFLFVCLMLCLLLVRVVCLCFVA